MRAITILALGSLLLSACDLTEPEVDRTQTATDVSSQLRLQANHIVPGLQTTNVDFASGKHELTGAAVQPLLPLVEEGVQSVRIVAPAKDSLHAERMLEINHFLRGHGINSSRISTGSDDTLSSGTYRLEFVTMDVTPPDCPNWTSSAATSYTNLPWSQLGCAYVTNIGAMLANPEDLEHGSGNVRPDAERNGVVMQQYHANKDWTPAATGGGASASGTQFGGGGGGGSMATPGGSGGSGQ